MISRSDAEMLLKQHIQDPYHLLHASMVSYAMGKYAEQKGYAQDAYYIAGLLHDIDFGSTYDVNEHGTLSISWLKDQDVPQNVLHAIQSHVEHRTGVKPESELDFALIACDEICGLMYAYSAIRPEKFKNLKVKSLVKCFYNEKFAAKVDRQLILQGINGIHTTLEDHLAFLVKIFQEFEYV